VKRILLVRLGALGDIVHAIPVAAALRRAFPSARIDWLVSAKHREILDLVPVIDRRIVIDDRRADVGSGFSRIGRPPATASASAAASADARPLLRTIAALRHERYDVVLDLQGLIKSAIIARLTGARTVIGFNSK
jgi:heptosyltransferase-1